MGVRPTEKVEEDLAALVKQFAKGEAGKEGRKREEEEREMLNRGPGIVDAVKDCQTPADEKEKDVVKRTHKKIREGQLRALRALARAREQGKDLVHLDPQEAAPWIRPFWEAARAHSLALQEELAEQSAVTLPIAYELATSRALYRAFLALGAKTNNIRALREARSWLKASHHCLQTFLALENRGKTSAGELGWLNIDPDGKKDDDDDGEGGAPAVDPYLPKGMIEDEPVGPVESIEETEEERRKIAEMGDPYVPQFHGPRFNLDNPEDGGIGGDEDDGDEG